MIANFLHWFRSGQYAWEDHRPRNGAWKGTSGGEAISFSGCDDDQTSADTSVNFHCLHLSVCLIIFGLYATMMLINCSHCHTPPRASSIRCIICKFITNVSDSWGVPIPPGTSHSLLPPDSLPHPLPSWGLALSSMPGGGGRKKAVICGVTYRNTRNELMGSINDAKCIKYLLINRFSFSESNIIMLTGTTTTMIFPVTIHDQQSFVRSLSIWFVWFQP
ncbi:hypothetical protein BHE74_00039782 [Ensete ventricosum]|nr:hypothetical protein BHE74_00039782 [Ensete ventricosum]